MNPAPAIFDGMFTPLANHATGDRGICCPRIQLGSPNIDISEFNYETNANEIFRLRLHYTR
jgi:hypothetical protein